LPKTSDFSIPPSGLNTPSGDGLDWKTTNEADALGRVTAAFHRPVFVMAAATCRKRKPHLIPAGLFRLLSIPYVLNAGFPSFSSIFTKVSHHKHRIEISLFLMMELRDESPGNDRINFGSNVDELPQWPHLMRCTSCLN
jgi:hypothetical protein